MLFICWDPQKFVHHQHIDNNGEIHSQVRHLLALKKCDLG
jgi:hypothetical protein